MTALEAVVPALPCAAEPILIPVPAAAVKVLPRWAEEDEVLRWRLRFREHHDGEPSRVGMSEDDGKPWTELELRPFTRELPLTGLSHGKLHYFKVAIETPDGWSNWSHTVACEPPSPGLPGKPAAVYAIVQDASSMLVRWTRPIYFSAAVSCGQIQRYKLLVTWKPMEGESVESCQREITIDDDVDCCEVGDLQCERDFQFQVAAENVTGWGPFSDVSPVVNVPSPVPLQMIAPTVRRPTHHSAVIQWQHPAATDIPVDSFRFRYSSSGDWDAKDVVEILDVSTHATQYTVEGLSPGRTYYFQATAVNRHGMGIWSENSLTLTTMDGDTPSKVEELSVPHKYSSFITLQWKPACPNGFPVTEHLLRLSYREDMSEPIAVDPVIHKKGGYERMDLKHLMKKCYWFQIATTNKKGQSEWSDAVKVDLLSRAALENP